MSSSDGHDSDSDASAGMDMDIAFGSVYGHPNPHDSQIRKRKRSEESLEAAEGQTGVSRVKKQKETIEVVDLTGDSDDEEVLLSSASQFKEEQMVADEVSSGHEQLQPTQQALSQETRDSTAAKGEPQMMAMHDNGPILVGHFSKRTLAIMENAATVEDAAQIAFDSISEPHPTVFYSADGRIAFRVIENTSQQVSKSTTLSSDIFGDNFRIPVENLRNHRIKLPNGRILSPRSKTNSSGTRRSISQGPLYATPQEDAVDTSEKAAEKVGAGGERKPVDSSSIVHSSKSTIKSVDDTQAKNIQAPFDDRATAGPVVSHVQSSVVPFSGDENATAGPSEVQPTNLSTTIEDQETPISSIKEEQISSITAPKEAKANTTSVSRRQETAGPVSYHQETATPPKPDQFSDSAPRRKQPKKVNELFRPIPETRRQWDALQQTIGAAGNPRAGTTTVLLAPVRSTDRAPLRYAVDFQTLKAESPAIFAKLAAPAILNLTAFPLKQRPFMTVYFRMMGDLGVLPGGQHKMDDHVEYVLACLTLGARNLLNDGIERLESRLNGRPLAKSYIKHIFETGYKILSLQKTMIYGLKLDLDNTGGKELCQMVARDVAKHMKFDRARSIQAQIEPLDSLVQVVKDQYVFYVREALQERYGLS